MSYSEFLLHVSNTLEWGCQQIGEVVKSFRNTCLEQSNDRLIASRWRTESSYRDCSLFRLESCFHTNFMQTECHPNPDLTQTSRPWEHFVKTASVNLVTLNNCMLIFLVSHSVTFFGIRVENKSKETRKNRKNQGERIPIKTCVVRKPL